METITVRRWVPTAPEQVWPHLFDLERLARGDPELELVALDTRDATDPVASGTAATVTRRRGHHLERIELRIEDRIERHVEDGVASAHLTVTASDAGQRWLVRLSIEALPGGGSDVRFHAERDPLGIRHRSTRPVTGARRHRAEQGIGSLLDGLARQLDTIPGTVGA